MMRALILMLALAVAGPALASADGIARDKDGKIKRSAYQVRVFKQTHPCPATGLPGACPGYVVDHIWPLCAGGPDRASNMQWQTRADSLVKDKMEKTMCRHKL